MPILTEVKREMLGTVFDVSIAHEKENDCRDLTLKIFSEGSRVEAAYSRFIGNNELFDLNNRRGKWVEIGPEFFELLKFGDKIFRSTDGAFDMTVKSILDGWGYDKDYSFTAGSAGSLGKIEFDEKNLKVRISAEVDLGGFGKGYVIDKMSAILRECGVENFCIDGGGDIYGEGRDEKGEKWKIHFGHPVNTDEAIGFVEVDGFACCSSNPVRRKWGVRHHLVDPKTGSPASKMLAVYTQAKSAMVADAYSTALFAMGYEKAKKWLEPEKAQNGGLTAARGQRPVEAMIISPAGKIYKSAGFRGELFC